MGIKHWLAHLLGYNLGRVETFWAGRKLMVCFRCSGCGQRSDAHEATMPRARAGANRQRATGMTRALTLNEAATSETRGQPFPFLNQERDTMKTSDLPTVGAQLGGGFYAGIMIIRRVQHALIVAPKADGEFKGKWLNTYDKVPGADDIADGLSNTLAMAEAGSPIAKQAIALNIAGFTDWHVPSRDALELLYRNFKPTDEENYCTFRDGENPSSVPIGHLYTEADPARTSVEAFCCTEAFEPTWYWSSTQSSSSDAFGQDFYFGNQDDNVKSYEGRVRAVRTIQLTA